MLKDFYVTWNQFNEQVNYHEELFVGALAQNLLRTLAAKGDDPRHPDSKYGLADLYYMPYDYQYPYLAELAMDHFDDDPDCFKATIQQLMGTNGFIPIKDVDMDIPIHFSLSKYLEERLQIHLNSALDPDQMKRWARCTVLTNEMHTEIAVIDPALSANLKVCPIPIRFLKRSENATDNAQTNACAAVVVFVPKAHVNYSTLNCPVILPEAVLNLKIHQELLDQELYAAFIVRFAYHQDLASDDHDVVLQRLDKIEEQTKVYYRYCEESGQPCLFPAPSIM